MKTFARKEVETIFENSNLHFHPTKIEIVKALEYAFYSGVMGGMMDSKIRREAEKFFEKEKPTKKELIAKFQEVIKNYTTKSEEADVIDMYNQDKIQLELVLKYWSENDNKNALAVANRMDTYPREHIPLEIWEEINS